MKFCIGDRVVPDDLLVDIVGENNVGKILDIKHHISSEDCAVVWDEDFGGHSCNGRCLDGHGLWCKPTHLILFKEVDYNLIPASDEELISLFDF